LSFTVNTNKGVSTKVFGAYTYSTFNVQVVSSCTQDAVSTTCGCTFECRCYFTHWLWPGIHS